MGLIDRESYPIADRNIQMWNMCRFLEGKKSDAKGGSAEDPKIIANDTVDSSNIVVSQAAMMEEVKREIDKIDDDE